MGTSLGLLSVAAITLAFSGCFDGKAVARRAIARQQSGGESFAQLSCDASSPGAASDTRRLTKTEIRNSYLSLFGRVAEEPLNSILPRVPEDALHLGVSKFVNKYSDLHLESLIELGFATAQAMLANDPDAFIRKHSSCMALGMIPTGANYTCGIYVRCNEVAITGSPEQWACGRDLNAWRCTNGGWIKTQETCGCETGGVLQTLVQKPSCASEIAESFGKRAWRRPLSSAEVADLKAAYDSVTGEREKLTTLIATILSAPEFLYHLELGREGAGSDDVYNLTQYEIASRLSFGLWDTTPDDSLLAKADQGKLSDPAELEATVDSMLADERSKKKVQSFFQNWLRLGSLEGVPTNPHFLAGASTEGLREESVRELYEYLDHILWERKGTYRELLTSTATFPRNPALTALYADGRKGLFSRAPFFFSERDSSNPIRRGVLFRTRILCNELGLPDAASVEAAKKVLDPMLAARMSVRERTAQMTSAPACMTCHSRINPIGFAMEDFDSLGRKRAIETNYNSFLEVIAQHPINAAVTDVRIDRAAGENVNGSEELFEKVADSTQGPSCFTRQAHRYYNLRMEDPVRDGCEILDASEAATQGSLVDSFKKLILNRKLSTKVVKR